VRAEGFSFNRLEPYSSFDEYLPEIERTWKRFVDVMSPIQIRRIVLRYINRIFLATADDFVDIGKYLRLNFALPAETGLELNGFFDQYSATEVETGHEVNVSVVAQPPKGIDCRSSLISKRLIPCRQILGVGEYPRNDCVLAAVEEQSFQENADRRMSEPISLTLALVGYGALHAAARSGTAVSAEADSIRRCASAVIASAERSFALFGRRATAISELLSFATEHARNGWDGENGRGISPHAVHIAEAIIRCLPDDLPMPEFAPEPDGSISLDWIYSRTRFVSISAGNNDRLPYAWIDGTDRGHAVARFDRERIPALVLDAIRVTMAPANAAVRVA
jgi:hypothetical protein